VRLAGGPAARDLHSSPPRRSSDLPPPAPPAAGEDDADPGRRLLLRRGAAIAAGLIATGAAGWGVHRAYRPPTVHRLDVPLPRLDPRDRKSTRLNSSHVKRSYAVFC